MGTKKEQCVYRTENQSGKNLLIELLGFFVDKFCAYISLSLSVFSTYTHIRLTNSSNRYY